jgi:hypothetical protein
MPEEAQRVGEYGQPVCPVCSRAVTTGTTAVRLNQSAWIHITCLDQAPITPADPKAPKEPTDRGDPKPRA